MTPKIANTWEQIAVPLERETVNVSISKSEIGFEIELLIGFVIHNRPV